MHPQENSASPGDPFARSGSTSELLILADGKILVHNLTPAFAALLSELNPRDEQIRPRTVSSAGATNQPQPGGVGK